MKISKFLRTFHLLSAKVRNVKAFIEMPGINKVGNPL
jgi:hypothetical protein